MFIIFETERLIVRQYTEDDKDNIFLMGGNETVMRYIRPVSTKEESDKFLLENLAFYKAYPLRGRWAVEKKETKIFVGSIGIIPIPSEPEKIQLGYALLTENWGMGYATELTKAALKYFFSHESLPVIYGVTEIPNVASQKVLLKAGFQFFEKKMEEEKEVLVFVVKRGLKF